MNQPASKEYLHALYVGKPISCCMEDMGGNKHRWMDFIVHITLDAITTRKGYTYSYRTGYRLGPGAPEYTSYIEEYINENL